MKSYSTVEEYFASLAQERRERLEQLRSIIRSALPKATECISYSMPAFDQNGIVIWYAAAKNHDGLYPKPLAIQAFAEELKGYTTSKGAIQLPLDKKYPVGLIKKIIALNLKHNLEAAALKQQKKRASQPKAGTTTSVRKKVSTASR